MAIEYSYEIISVDQDARCMEVVYSSSGRPTQHIGARLPFEGESLEAVIRMFAPVPYWSELESSVVAPSVGVSGQISEIEIPLSDRVRIERDAAPLSIRLDSGRRCSRGQDCLGNLPSGIA
jgi:hypothetical protein